MRPCYLLLALLAALLLGSASARPLPLLLADEQSSSAHSWSASQAQLADSTSALSAVDALLALSGSAVGSGSAVTTAAGFGSAAATATPARATATTSSLPSRIASLPTLPTITVPVSQPEDSTTRPSTRGRMRAAPTNPFDGLAGTTTRASPAGSGHRHAASPSPIPAGTRGTGALSGGGCPDIQATLDAHNAARARRGAAPLTWSVDLAQYAQGVANTCVLQHSGGPYGENLALGSTLASCADAVALWMAEEGSYMPDAPSHFSQVVWKGTTEVGCGFAPCGMVACSYSPPGNVMGEYAANV